MKSTYGVFALAMVFVAASAVEADFSVRYGDKADSKKCYLKYQVCCKNDYECGYTTEKYLIPKKCSKKYCHEKKEPKTQKKCETKYGYKKVCKQDNSYGKTDYKKYGSSKVAVRSYDKKDYCYNEKYPYQHCYTYTTYETKHVCYDKYYDCPYYGDKKVPKYCTKHECGEVKYKSAEGYY